MTNSGSPFGQWIKGLELAESELIWIAEDDDFCEPDFLESLIPCFDDDNVKFAFTNSHIIDEYGVITGDYLETEYLKSLSNSKWHTDYKFNC